MTSPDATCTRPYLRRIALDILYRTPSPSETRVYLDAPADMVVTRMAGQIEAMNVWLEEELFYFLLLDNFRPQNKSILALPKRLSQQRVHVRDAIGEIIASPSFSRRNPGNDTFVSVVLEQGLGMTVQDRKNVRTLEAGKKMYDGHEVRFLGERGASQSDLVKIILGQEDFARHLLDRHHQRLFGTPLAERDDTVETWVGRVHEDPHQFFAVLREWLTSDRYWQALPTKKLVTDRQFIRSLYMDLLQRLPTYEEMRNMRNALQSMADPAPLRAVMAKVILDSGKANLPKKAEGAEEEFVTECFRRYLGRPPGQRELPAFVEIARDPACTEVEVVRALVGSAEYQYY